MGHEQVFRWRYDRPPSIEEFTNQFPDDWSCANWLAKKRWPSGFVCPKCGSTNGWKLRTRPWVWECGGSTPEGEDRPRPCGRQTSVIAGTIMHGTHLPLRTWFLAAHLVATHSNGISALQLQAKLGIASYKTAWLLLQKLRRAMIDPDRRKLDGPVEVDETVIQFRRKTEPVGGGQGRSMLGKMAVAGAVECLDEGRCGRLRLQPISSFKAEELRGFLAENVNPGGQIVTDGWSGYAALPKKQHKAKVVGSMAAHIPLPRIHRVFMLLKTWAAGVYHGLRPHHLDIYLQEFVFRWNRRRHYRSSFDSLMRIGLGKAPTPYKDLIANWFDHGVRRWVRSPHRTREDRAKAFSLLMGNGYAADEAARIAALEPKPSTFKTYERQKPPRPVLAKRRTAFVYATH